jgi:hypothetical protein
MTDEQKVFDLEAIERRHAAGSPAQEDYGDLIAEVKRLGGGEVVTESDEMTPAYIHKLRREELDALAEQNGLKIEGLNVKDTQELLIETLCPESK